MEITKIDKNEILALNGEIDIDKHIKNIENFNKVIEATLIKGIDIAIIPNTEKPSLLKSGAEKIARVLNLVPRYEILNIDELGATIRCNLTTIEETPKIVGEMIAHAPYNIKVKENIKIQNCIMIAQKRAFVGAIRTIGAISALYTQDMENEEVKENLLLKGSKAGKFEKAKLYSAIYKKFGIDGKHKDAAKAKEVLNKIVKSYNPKFTSAMCDDITNQDIEKIKEAIEK